MRVLLAVYDNQSYLSEFPIGLAYIASVTEKRRPYGRNLQSGYLSLSGLSSNGTSRSQQV